MNPLTRGLRTLLPYGKVDPTPKPMTFAQAEKAAKELNRFLNGRVDAFLKEREKTDEPTAMRKVFGPQVGPRDVAEENLLGVFSFSGHFFYSITQVDLRSGEVFQSSPGNQTDFYGPLKPPAKARIVGQFSEAERDALSELVHFGRKLPNP